MIGRPRRRSSGGRRPQALVAAVAVIVLVTGAPTTAGAAMRVDPRGATLSPSASCAQGDIDITYSATDVARQVTEFTAGDGSVLHHHDLEVYASNHDGVEHILSQNRQPPPAGSIVAVYVTIGASPPDADSGEFFVAYRCDTRTNKDGGNNEVVSTCVDRFGTCPRTAADLGAEPTTTAPPALSAAGEPTSPSRSGPFGRTGADVLRLAVPAVLAVLLGTVLSIAARRRRAR